MPSRHPEGERPCGAVEIAAGDPSALIRSIGRISGTALGRFAA
ncbi:hypothetical protein ACFVYV_27345 [Streptomyces mirabilis]